MNLNLQQAIMYYNDHKCLNKLKLPNEIKNMTLKEGVNKALEYYYKKGIKFSFSMDYLHPNLLIFFCENSKCKIIRENNKCFIKFQNGNKIKIKRQDYFGYELVNILKK